MKRARKVALISVYDYPKNDYSAYWNIDKPEGDDVLGWRWGAHLSSYAPLAWEFKGKRTEARPGVPVPSVTPENPADVAAYRELAERMYADANKAAAAGELYSVLAPDVPVQQDAYLKLDAAGQANVRYLQDLRRAQVSVVQEMHPKAIHEIDHAVGVAKTRDKADTAAQTWVLERIGKHRRASPLRVLSDEDVQILVAEFDAARAKKDFAVVDRIRGVLKSQGVALKEPEKIGAAGATSWKRKPGGKEAGYALALGPGGMIVDAIAELILWLLRPLLALAYNSTVRNEMVQRVQVNIDLGAGAGLFDIYDSTRPASCGTATTLLAQLTFGDPSAPSSAAGVLTMNAITADASANAAGTATWFRNKDSTGTCVVDGNVGTSGSDLNLNSTSISAGQQVSVTSYTITEGNP